MEPENIDWTKLTFAEDGVDYLTPVVDVVLYWTGSVFDRVDGIVDFYQRSLEYIQSELTFYRTESFSAARKIRSDTLGLLPFWLQQTKTRREIYMLYLESAAVKDAPSDHAFCFHALEFPGKEMGMVRLMLPVSFVDHSDEAFRDLALGLARTMDYTFGQAGYAYNWNDLGDYTTEALSAMSALGRRYPGIDLSYPAMTEYAAFDGIKCINWLTFLNSEHASRLGGIAKLRRALGTGIEFHTLPAGPVVQAGPEPRVGDVNRRLTLPQYHRAGSILAPLRSANHPPFLGRRGEPSAEATEKWLSRFDE